MNNGRYVMQRRWQDHPLFENDVYSRRDAWEWLISEALHVDGERDVNGKMVYLNRGQLSHSIRFIAKKWKWKKSTAARFLDRLKKEGMIETKDSYGVRGICKKTETASRTGQSIITICNYDKYQFTPKNNGTPSGTEAGQERDKDKEVNNTSYEGDGKSPGVPPVKNLWTDGVNYLQSAGLTEKIARSFIGKLRSQHGDGEALTAIVAAQSKSVSDPAAWITAYFKNHSRASTRADLMN